MEERDALAYVKDVGVQMIENTPLNLIGIVTLKRQVPLSKHNWKLFCYLPVHKACQVRCVRSQVNCCGKKTWFTARG